MHASSAMWLPTGEHLHRPRTAHIQFAQLGEATALNRLQDDHEALGLDVVAREVEVLQLRERVEQHRVADEANALVLHLDAYASLHMPARTVQHQVLDGVHGVLAEVAQQRRHALVADAVAAQPQLLQLRRGVIGDGTCQEQHRLLVDLVVL